MIDQETRLKYTTHRLMKALEMLDEAIKRAREDVGNGLFILAQIKEEGKKNELPVVQGETANQ